MPTFGSLFSGIGGLDLGLERAGWECKWQVEIDEWCRRVLARHWPHVPKYADAKGFLADPKRPRRDGIHEREQSGHMAPDAGVGGQDVSDWRPAVDNCGVDLICGGFPCQPVSLAGKRLGQDDERWLWPEFARIVRVLRPRFVLVENVPGLLARGMGDVLGDLATCGYDAEWDCIPAAAVGAPHLRYRVFVVAYSRGNGSVADPERESGELRRGLGDVPAAPGATEGEAQQRQRNRTAVRGSGADVAITEHGRPRRILGRPRDTDSEGSVSQLAGSSWWASEPDVGRVANGVPSRVDRLRGLGNAVVPQIAEYVGRRLMELV